MRLLLAANNQATRRNEIIKSYWVQAATDMHPACPTRNQIIYKTASSDGPILGPENLLKTGFAQKGLPSCPSGRHKPQSFIETKTLRFCNLDTTNFKKMNLNIRRSHFWDRMHRLAKKQKKSSFTVSFSGPSGGAKNETAKSTAKVDPVQRTKNNNCV